MGLVASPIRFDTGICGFEVQIDRGIQMDDTINLWFLFNLGVLVLRLYQPKIQAEWVKNVQTTLNP